MNQLEILAMQAMQQALSNAPQQQKKQPPPGVDPAFYDAMVKAGATPPESPAPQGIPAPQQAPMAPPMAGGPQGPNIGQFPQQAPVMSPVPPAPASPARTNVNNGVTMPMPTFTPASQRPQLPQFQPQGLSPNLGAYAPAPSMPAYGMPRMGGPFKAPEAPQGLPTFANFGGGYAAQPTAQEPDPALYGGIGPGMINGRNLFSRY